MQRAEGCCWALSHAVIATVLSILLMGRASAREIGPEANLCAEINALLPGQELVLKAGDYKGPCTFRRGGVSGNPLVVRAQSRDHRPRIIYAGKDSNVFNIRAGNIVIRGLEFGPTHGNVDGIRIYSGDEITVEDCKFSEIGGIAVVANHASVRDLIVRRNIIENAKATAMYFGCHNGLECAVSGLIVEQNYIHGVDTVRGGIGYGVQVKLNSTAMIRDNVIMDTKGPGIMIYGAHNDLSVSLVERNLTASSRASSGIVIGGGPAIVLNNVAVSNAEAGIDLQNYGRRDLLRGIAIAHNTVYDNGKAGILVSDGKLRDIAVVNNAAQARPGTLAFMPGRQGLRLAGNVDCSSLPCFADPAARNFSPLPSSPLFGKSDGLPDAWSPVDDFFGKRRAVPAVVGAIEGENGAIPMGIKR